MTSLKKVFLLLQRVTDFQVFRLIKNSLIYGIGDMVQKFLSILLLPIYTRYLTPADYGIIALLGIFTLVVGTITLCGLNNGINRYFYYTEQEGTTKDKLVWSSTYFIILITTVVILVMMIFSAKISVLLFNSDKYTYILLLTLLGILISNVSLIGRTMLIIQEKAMIVSYVNIAGVITGAGTGVIFVVLLKRGVIGAIEGALAGQLIMGIAIFLLSIARYKPSFSWTVLVKQLKFCLPMVPAVLAFFVIDSFDRYLLKEFRPLSEVGLYNIGCSIGYIIMIAVGGFSSAWSPYYYKKNQNNEGQAICNNVLKLYLLLVCPCVVIISFASPLAIKLLTTPEFYQAYTVVPFIAMAYMLQGPFFILIIGVLMKNKTTWTMYLETMAAIASIGLNIIFIPMFGREAAAITTLISYGLIVLGGYWLVMRINPIPNLKIGLSVFLLLLTFLFSGSVLWIAKYPMFLYIGLACIIILVFTVIMAIIGYKEFHNYLTN